MKKSIVTVLGITLSALAAVVTSCTNDEVIASAERHGGKVGFGFSVEQMEGEGAVNTREAAIVSQVMDGSGDSPVYLTTATTGYVNSRISGSSAATKGVSVTSDSFYDNFGLFIYEYDASSDWASVASTANLAKDNVKMLKSSGWITDKYWPGNQKKLTFFAYAPHSDNYTSVSVSNTTVGPTLSYTVPDNVSDQKDLLVTKHSDTHPTQDIAGDKNQVVNMAFYHALTAVQFKIGGTMAPCTIKTITVSGVNSKGTYNFSNDTWTSQSTTATYTISPDYEVNSTTKNTTFTTSENNMLMLLMPQTLPSDAKITITINDGQERTLTLPINDQVWQAGHSVTYTLSTASEADTYQISVTDAALNETGGNATCTVTSYRQTYYGTQIPVGWTATYHVDEETTEQTEDSEYVTSFTSANSSPSATTTNLSATLDKLYFVSDATSNTITSQLRAKDEVKYTDGSHYNLSNSTGAADIQNTANCYIVNAPGYYRIPMVYGNGYKDGSENSASIGVSNTFVNSAGAKIDKAKISDMQTINNAVLVWQDAYHLIDPKSVKISGDFIEFYIPQKYICEGNAVLAARDENNNILWSWHIWVTGETIGTSSNVAIKNRTGTGTTYNFMKLPLGFCHEDTRTYPTRNIHLTITQNGSSKTAQGTIVQSSESSEILGVNAPYFQYGRKDPFCPSNGKTNTNKTLYDSQIGFTDFKSQSGAVATNVSIQNPHIFYYVLDSNWNTVDSKDFWDVGNSDNGLYDASSDKSVKSVYDPSPVGYKTPEPAAWTRFTTYNGGDNTSSSQYFNVANKSSFSADGGWKFYTESDGTGNWDLWHALGFRDVYSKRLPTPGTGGLLGVGSYGDYWSCGPSTTATYGRYLDFPSGGVGPQYQSCRAFGFTVRPVSEQ
ncbi:MAG: fimbrillin family protein [Prevotella sp.]